MKLGEAFEIFIPGKADAKGRTFGYVVGLREDLETGECYAWVQRAVAKAGGGWEDYGVPQRSKKFANLEAARTWAYRTARERAAK